MDIIDNEEVKKLVNTPYELRPRRFKDYGYLKQSGREIYFKCEFCCTYRHEKDLVLEKKRNSSRIPDYLEDGFIYVCCVCAQEYLNDRYCESHETYHSDPRFDWSKCVN